MIINSLKPYNAYVQIINIRSDNLKPYNRVQNISIR